MLLMTLNLGAVAQDLIFSDGFESGWPDAWPQAVGWSAFVVRDSTGKLVGPVVDWWTSGSERISREYLPIVAVRISTGW